MLIHPKRLHPSPAIGCGYNAIPGCVSSDERITMEFHHRNGLGRPEFVPSRWTSMEDYAASRAGDRLVRMHEADLMCEAWETITYGAHLTRCNRPGCQDCGYLQWSALPYLPQFLDQAGPDDIRRTEDECPF